jgi:hypothetical protein
VIPTSVPAAPIAPPGIVRHVEPRNVREAAATAVDLRPDRRAASLRQVDAFEIAASSSRRCRRRARLVGPSLRGPTSSMAKRTGDNGYGRGDQQAVRTTRAADVSATSRLPTVSADRGLKAMRMADEPEAPPPKVRRGSTRSWGQSQRRHRSRPRKSRDRQSQHPRRRSRTPSRRRNYRQPRPSPPSNRHTRIRPWRGFARAVAP